jgi:predicted permease
MENLIIIFALLLLGMTLSKLKIFPDNASQILNLFIIYISLPALILLQVPRLTFSKELLVPALIPWVMLFFQPCWCWRLPAYSDGPGRLQEHFCSWCRLATLHFSAYQW